MPFAPHAIELLEQHVSTSASGVPSVAVDRHRVEKRLLGRQQRAADRRGQTALDQRPIEARAALRRQAAEARPEVQPLRAGQHRVEHQQREEIRDRRRPARERRPSGRPSCLPCESRDGARRSARARPCARRDGAGPGGMRAEMTLDPAQRLVGRPRRRRRRASRCWGRSSGGSSRTDRRGSSSRRSDSQPIVGCRYGCALNAVAVSS